MAFLLLRNEYLFDRHFQVFPYHDESVALEQKIHWIHLLSNQVRYQHHPEIILQIIRLKNAIVLINIHMNH
jgi:Trm5-related predicted tRNA methylase